MNENEINDGGSYYLRETTEGFVKLKMPKYYIAKHSDEDLQAAVLKEREACALVCEEKALYFQYDFIPPYDVADSCAEEIRARGGEMKDGIALESIAHPEGDPVLDDHEINPDSLETMEIDIPIDERIKQLAEQAGLAYKMSNGMYWIDAGEVDIHLERFAELVSEQTHINNKAKWYQEGYEAGQRDEREACAKLCEQEHDNYLRDEETDRADGAMWCAAAIRGRTE